MFCFRNTKILFWFLGVLFLFSSTVVYAQEISECNPDVGRLQIIPGSELTDDNNFSLTVQAQDQTGNACKVSSSAPSPLRVSFSTSGSGIFTRHADNEPPIGRINRGNSNHHFYYRNGSLNDVISIRAYYDDLSGEWQISSKISDILIEEDYQSEVEDNGQNEISTNSLSAHSGVAPLSFFEPTQNLKIGAGRERLGAVDESIKFKAEISDSTQGGNFTWVFGDGYSAVGQEVSHRYLKPGRYVVVLNYSSNSLQMTSRTEVVIIEPEIKVEIKDDHVWIINQSADELNVGDWEVSTASVKYTLPTDTILLKNGHLALPVEILGSLDGTVDVRNSAGQSMLDMPIKAMAIEEIALLLVEAGREAERAKQMVEARSAPPPTYISEPPALEEQPIENIDNHKDESMPAVIEIRRNPSPASAILSLPTKTIDRLKRMFKR